MKRLVTAMVAALLVLSSCGGAQDTTTSDATSTITTSPTSTTSTSSTPPTTTTTTTTTMDPSEVFPVDTYREMPAIVTAADGVYEIAVDGSTRKLLDGNVALAIDDTQGGLLYQIDRGRDWQEEGARDTTIWWLRAGSSEPRDLLVPTRAEGHELSLHDAYYDGGLHVVYTRHEGQRSHPMWPFIVDDRLRSFDVEQRSTTDLALVPAWEAGLGSAQCGGGLIAYIEYNQIGSNCEFVDRGGAPVSIPADVEARDCEIDCRRQCALGWGGELLMYNEDYYVDDDSFAGTTVVFVNSQTSIEIARELHLGASLQVGYVDLLGNRVLINTSEGGVVYDMANLSDGAQMLSVVGEARFASAPIELPSTVNVGS